MASDQPVAGFSATPDLQAKLDSLDDNLQPLNEEIKNDKAEIEAEEIAEEKDEAVEEAENTEDEAESSETEPTEGEESKDSKDDGEDGYTIDDGDEEEKEAPTTSTEIKQPSQLTAEQQYIIDNISPFKVNVILPGKETAEVVEIYTSEQLPDGFKYASQKDADYSMMNSIQNDRKAEQLTQDFRNQESQKAAKEFKIREDNADRQDIGNLQRDGDIPRFKLEPNDPKFDSDPGVKLVNDVLKFKEEVNQRYMDEYNSGRPYKHIGFEEAFRLYKYKNPDTVDVALQEEDNARKAIAKRTSKSRGSDSQPSQRTKVRPGMTSRDLDNLIENLDW